MTFSLSQNRDMNKNFKVQAARNQLLDLIQFMDFLAWC